MATCNQCEALMINGVFCHETGCPNAQSRYDVESGTWIKQRDTWPEEPCAICGKTYGLHYYGTYCERGCEGPQYTPAITDTEDTGLASAECTGDAHCPHCFDEGFTQGEAHAKAEVEAGEDAGLVSPPVAHGRAVKSGKGSRLRKYVCACGVIIRAGTDTLAAQCDLCHQPFLLSVPVSMAASEVSEVSASV